MTNFFSRNGSLLALSFTLPAFFSFLLDISFCVVAAVPRVLRIWESVFYLTLFSHIWCKHCQYLLLSRFHWEPVALSWRLKYFPLWFKTQIWPICLFESHSALQTDLQERVLFSLKVELKNTAHGFKRCLKTKQYLQDKNFLKQCKNQCNYCQDGGLNLKSSRFKNK